MANSLGDMVVRIIGDTAGFNKSLDETQKKMIAAGVNAAAMGAAIILATKAIAKAVGDFTDYGSAIYDASQKTGLSTQAIQEWKFIAEQSGTTLQTVTSSVALMTKGLKTNADLFRQLGIETKNTNGTFRSTTEIFNDTIKKLSSMKDATERDQLAFKLLGRGAQDMIPILNAGGIALDDMRNEAHNLGIVLSDEVITSADKLGDNIDALKSSFQATGNQLISALAPALISISNGLKNLIVGWNSLDKGSKAFILSVSALAVGIIPLISGFINLGKAITGVKATLEILSTSKTLLKVASGGWITLAISGVIALGVAFIALTKSAEESRAKLKEIERLKLGGSTTDAQASIKLVSEEYDRQLKILTDMSKVSGRTQEQVDNQNKLIATQKALVQSLSDTLKAQIRNVDNLLRTAEGTAQIEAETRKLEQAKADLAALELSFTGLAIDNNNAQLSGISSIVETTEEAEKAKTDFQQAYLDRSVEIYNEDLKNQEEFNKQSAKAIEDANNRKIASYQKLADNIVSVMAPTFDFIGQSLVDQTFSWNGLANVAINSIGGIVSALGDQLAAEAAIQLVKGFMALASIVEAPLAPGYFASAALGAAGAAAAWAAGGALKAVKLADGGIVQPQPGGVQSLIAEAGQAEAVIPLDRLDSMLAKAGGYGGDGGMMNLVVNLDSRPLLDKIFEATRNRTVLISSGAVV